MDYTNDKEAWWLKSLMQWHLLHMFVVQNYDTVSPPELNIWQIICCVCHEQCCYLVMTFRTNLFWTFSELIKFNYLIKFYEQYNYNCVSIILNSFHDLNYYLLYFSIFRNYFIAFVVHCNILWNSLKIWP